MRRRPRRSRCWPTASRFRTGSRRPRPCSALPRSVGSAWWWCRCVCVVGVAARVALLRARAAGSSCGSRPSPRRGHRGRRCGSRAADGSSPTRVARPAARHLGRPSSSRPVACAACCGSARSPGRRTAHSPSWSSSGGERLPAGAPGLEVPRAISFSAAFSNSASASRRLSVAFSSLQVLKPLRVIGLQPAGLVAPPVVGLFRDLQLAAHVGHVLALAQHPISRRELAHDLLRAVPLLVAMSCRAFLPNHWAASLHSSWINQAGSGHSGMTVRMRRARPVTRTQSEPRSAIAALGGDPRSELYTRSPQPRHAVAEWHWGSAPRPICRVARRQVEGLAG